MINQILRRTHRKSILQISKRTFSLNTDKDFKKDFDDEKREKKEDEGQDKFRRFEQPYRKPDFLKDEYDHLQKGPGHATI